MALRHIVTVGDSVLTKVSRPVTSLIPASICFWTTWWKRCWTPAAWDWQRPRWEFCAGGSR